MAQLTIDFSQVEEFEPLPAGEYPVVIDHVEMRTGKDSGKPYLNWDLVIADGEYTGRHLFMASGIGDKSLWRLKQIFENLGVLEEGEMTIEVDDESGYVLTPELVGLPAVAVVKNELYQNRVQNRVDDLLSSYEEELPTAPPPTPAPAAKPVARPAVATTPTPAPRPRPTTPQTTRPKLNLK